jgi:hypothetical protein
LGTVRADTPQVTADRPSYLKQMQATVRRPLHRDTVQTVEFEITKRFKGFSGPVPVIAGGSGTGKSSLLRHIHEHQQRLGRIVGIGEAKNGLETAIIAATRQIITELAKSATNSDIVESLSAALSRYLRAFASDLSKDERVSQHDSLMAEIADASGKLPNGILILLDDIDAEDPHQVLGFTDGVLALSETGSPLLLVCTSSSDRRDSRWPRSQKPYRLKPTVADIVELSYLLGFDVTRDELAIVAEQCKGNLYEASSRLRALAVHRNPGAHQIQPEVAQLVPQREPAEQEPSKRAAAKASEAPSREATAREGTAREATAREATASEATASERSTRSTVAPTVQPRPMRSVDPVRKPIVEPASTPTVETNLVPAEPMRAATALPQRSRPATEVAPAATPAGQLAERTPGESRIQAESTASKFAKVAESAQRLPAATGPLDPFRNLRNSERRQTLQQQTSAKARSSDSPTDTVRASVTPRTDTKPPAAAPRGATAPPDQIPFGDEDQLASLQAALTQLSESDTNVSLRGQSFKRLGG